jgi:ABC-type spermidine/putrescine transport system permease subunit II
MAVEERTLHAAGGVEVPGERRRLMAVGALPLSLLLLVVLAVPVGVLALYSVWTPGFFTVTREFTPDNYVEVLTNETYRSLLLKTLAVGLACASLLVVFGFAMAYAITFKLPRWGSRVLVFVTASLLASYLVRIYAWKAILGDQGILNRLLLEVGLIDGPLEFLLYGYFAIVLTLVYVYLPFSVLLIYAGLQNIDRQVFEASGDQGANRFRTLRKVTIPLAAPALAASFAVCFILTTADYVTPQLVGGLQGQMVGRVVADQFGPLGNYPLGAALSFVLVAAMALSLGVLYVVGKGLGGLGRRLEVARRRRRSDRRRTVFRDRGPLSRLVHGFPYTETATALLLVFLFVPMLTVVLFSLNAGNVPGLPFRGFTLRWYGEVIRSSEFRTVLWNSVQVMVVAVAASLLVGVPAALALVRRSFRLRGGVRAATFGPIAIPGVVIGVALLTSFVFVGITLGTAPTAAAHLLLLVPYVVLVVQARLLDMDPRIEEAARDLGANRKRVFRTITLPLLLAPLVGAGLLCAAISLDDVIVTNFVSGTEPTVPVWILGVMRRSFTPAVNAVAVLILAGSLTLISIATLVFRRTRSGRLTDVVAGANRG